MDLITYALAKKHGGGGESITYTLTADTENKTIVLTPSEGTAQVITVPYATDASTVNGHEVPELENGKIPANFLPSFVDNVDEYDTISLFPVIGESNRIYIDKSTNKTYRWSGTAYVEISESIALGETSSTAYRGDRGKIAYDHSQSAHAPSNAEANQNAFSNIKIDSDTINASTATDTLEFIAGDNIILTPNVSNKKITVSQAPVRKSASGDIASFSDGAGYPFLKVKANINPVQDLHGYDYPWVGGAGYNKWDEEWSVETVSSEQRIVSKNPIKVISGETYYVKSPANTILYFNAVTSTGSYVRYLGPVGGSTQTLVVPSDVEYVSFSIGGSYGTTYNNDIAINYPSTVTTYRPYSNICPISGFTGVNVAVFGKNLFDKSKPIQANYYNDGGVEQTSVNTGHSELMPCYPNTYYTLSGKLKVINNFITGFYFWDANKNWISRNVTGEVGAQTVLTPPNCHYISLQLATPQGAISSGLDINTVQVEQGSSATAYEAYNSNSHVYPISWQDEAEIVYGGYIDLVSGVLTVTKAGIAEYNGETLPSAWISDRDRYVAGNTPTIGAQVVYDLTTPQTYQLTSQQINTLIGQNNVWNNTNGQTEVEYKAPFYNDLTTKNEVQALINESITSALNASY